MFHSYVNVYPRVIWESFHKLSLRGKGYADRIELTSCTLFRTCLGTCFPTMHLVLKFGNVCWQVDKMLHCSCNWAFAKTKARSTHQWGSLASTNSPAKQLLPKSSPMLQKSLGMQPSNISSPTSASISFTFSKSPSQAHRLPKFPSSFLAGADGSKICLEIWAKCDGPRPGKASFYQGEEPPGPSFDPQRSDSSRVVQRFSRCIKSLGSEQMFVQDLPSSCKNIMPSQ